MQTGRQPLASLKDSSHSNVVRSIRDGLSYMFKDSALRTMFLLIAVANLAFGGPMIVGIPYLANTRFPEGAAAYGLIISGYAGGNLLGIILSGLLPKMKQKQLSPLMVMMFLTFALGTAGLAWFDRTWVAMIDMLLLGILNGYLAIMLITALQRSTPREMLGRVMSMVLLANLGLMPLSQAIAGAVLRWNVPLLFLTAGGLMALCAIYLALPGVGSLLGKQLASD
jgi:hypothetical protein